jgi:hypothetical protein
MAGLSSPWIRNGCEISEIQFIIHKSLALLLLITILVARSQIAGFFYSVFLSISYWGARRNLGKGVEKNVQATKISSVRRIRADPIDAPYGRHSIIPLCLGLGKLCMAHSTIASLKAV